MRTQLGIIALLLSVGCQNSTNLEQIVSQQYVHKYGFSLTEQDWEQRPQDGQVVTVLKNGIKIARTYENGQLHGLTTYTFPNSDVVEKSLLYDRDTLLKETLCDRSGMPMREEVYEFDERTIITLWNEQGAPLSIEEYDGELLVEGKYYTLEHELEAKVENGSGERVKRDRGGLLISRDLMQNGMIAERTTYHPNGQVHTVSHYHDYQLHGEQVKYSAEGRPLMKLRWDHGVLDGMKVAYRNGYKVAEIPYVKGQKQGLEYHYDDLGNLTAEIQWRDDKKHGCSKFYSDEGFVENEWFFNGQAVSASKFEIMENREQMIAEFSAE